MVKELYTAKRAKERIGRFLRDRNSYIFIDGIIEDGSRFGRFTKYNRELYTKELIRLMVKNDIFVKKVR